VSSRTELRSQKFDRPPIRAGVTAGRGFECLLSRVSVRVETRERNAK
jgi:hypothetical protein